MSLRDKLQEALDAKPKRSKCATCRALSKEQAAELAELIEDISDRKVSASLADVHRVAAEEYDLKIGYNAFLNHLKYCLGVET